MLNGDIHCNTYTYMNGFCASTIIIPVTAFSCVCTKGVENPFDFKPEWCKYDDI